MVETHRGSGLKRPASPALELFLISVAKLILTWQKTVLIAIVFPSWLPDVSKRTGCYWREAGSDPRGVWVDK